MTILGNIIFRRTIPVEGDRSCPGTRAVRARFVTGRRELHHSRRRRPAILVACGSKYGAAAAREADPPKVAYESKSSNHLADQLAVNRHPALQHAELHWPRDTLRCVLNRLPIHRRSAELNVPMIMMTRRD